MTIKEEAKNAIDTLPKNANLDEIMDALYVLTKFHHGEKQIMDGKGVLHTEAKRRLSKWLK